MTELAEKTLLLTGANSGVGLEAAAQLADAGWGRIVLACRTVEKAEAARGELVSRVGRDPFVTLAMDTSEVASARLAAEELSGRGYTLDALILNAGASSSVAKFNADGVELTYASTLVGHHVLTVRLLLELGLLAPDCRILIAGSEGARGNLPGMKVHDVEGLARESFDGDVAAAIESLARIEVQGAFVNMDEYVTAKRVVAWWASALARRVPAGMVVNAVSPGSAPGSKFTRGASASMRVMVGFMKVIGPMLGMAGSVPRAAKRYVDALELDASETGHFYATAHRKKLVGPMERQTWPEALTDADLQDAAFEAVVALTGTPLAAGAGASGAEGRPRP